MTTTFDLIHLAAAKYDRAAKTGDPKDADGNFIGTAMGCPLCNGCCDTCPIGESNERWLEDTYAEGYNDNVGCVYTPWRPEPGMHDINYLAVLVDGPDGSDYVDEFKQRCADMRDWLLNIAPKYKN